MSNTVAPLDGPDWGNVRPEAFQRIFEESGEFETKDPLTLFFYLLLRDHLAAGVVEEIVMHVIKHDHWTLSNGWLGEYAAFISKRLSENIAE